MKKLVLTLALLVALTSGVYAQREGGIFGKGYVSEEVRDGNSSGSQPLLPGSHGLDSDQNADGPLGSGIAVLVGLGAAYVLGKRRKED